MVFPHKSCYFLDVSRQFQPAGLTVRRPSAWNSLLSAPLVATLSGQSILSSDEPLWGGPSCLQFLSIPWPLSPIYPLFIFFPSPHPYLKAPGYWCSCCRLFPPTMRSGAVATFFIEISQVSPLPSPPHRLRQYLDELTLSLGLCLPLRFRALCSGQHPPHILGRMRAPCGKRKTCN